MMIAIFCILYFFTSTTITNGEDCCPLKDVGGKLYKFVDHVSKEDKERLKCSNTCAYKHAEKDSETKYCFKPGMLQSSCGKAEYVSDKAGQFILPIKIENELSTIVSGDIIYEDNYPQKYKVSPKSSEDIVPVEGLSIKEITGKTGAGVICTPYLHKGDEEPKRKFHVVADDEGGCLILPASEQYHHIQPVQWLENEKLVTQHDYFHPGTREAIMKTEAHGDIKETTIIVQDKKSTKSRMSAGFGLYVTATGSECYVNELTDEIGINPEHMIVAPHNATTRGRTNSRVEKKTTHRYVTNLIHARELISPDDERVKLTETMKKACKGKNIYYNSQHILESDKEFKSGITINKDKDGFKKLMSKVTMKRTKRQVPSVCNPTTIKTVYNKRPVNNCGIWTYGGVTTDPTGTLVPPHPLTMQEIADEHYHSLWTIASQCCPERGTQLFPCDDIKNEDSLKEEQAFSTAFALSLGIYYYGRYNDGKPVCLGQSRFCEWDPDADTYASLNLAVKGACTSSCKSYCNNWSGYSDTNPVFVNDDTYPQGCFKCYGMFPGLFPSDPYKIDPKFDFGNGCKPPA